MEMYRLVDFQLDQIANCERRREKEVVWAKFEYSGKKFPPHLVVLPKKSSTSFGRTGCFVNDDIDGKSKEVHVDIEDYSQASLTSAIKRAQKAISHSKQASMIFFEGLEKLK